MICQNPQTDTLHKSRFSLNLHSNSPISDTKRTDKVFPIEKSRVEKDSHWEKIESYYVHRLDTLSKEIETSTAQNNKLTEVRDELLSEILKLHQKSVDLNQKNESLIRSIAEKENQISAFMYQEPAVGVTLVDPPYSSTPSFTPHTPTSPLQQVETITTTTTTTNNTKKEHHHHNSGGIFRQISLRLSSRKKRHHEETTSLNISDPIPIASSSEPLLHPAAVVQTGAEKKQKNMFGNDLIDQAQLEKSVIPSIILKCVREVESRGLLVEGIYRKSGTFGQVKQLKEEFNQNKQPKLSNYQDIHVVSSLLKLYLRELTLPILSKDFICKKKKKKEIYVKFDATNFTYIFLIVNTNTMSSQERLNKTYSLLRNLPIEAYCTIKFLVQHLKKVHQHSATNKMTSTNLAVVFGPTLMRFIAGNEEQQMKEMIQTVDFIILQSHILFAEYS
ncbi:Rho GTPase activation protein [Pilaira anomala]|nr:Rho GTPase activation protein [Pilaira anomala]